MRIIEVRKELIERYDEHVENIRNTKEPRSKVHSVSRQNLISYDSIINSHLLLEEQKEQCLSLLKRIGKITVQY